MSIEPPNKDQYNNLKERYIELELSKLKDLDALGHINWFPLGPGWWVIVTIIFVVLLKAIINYFRLLAYKRTYKSEIFDELTKMQKSLSNITAQAIAKKLSSIIRRLSMHYSSRNQCASLEGKNWLKWLKAFDKNKFDWEKNGHILIKSIYENPNTVLISLKDLNALIEATKKWVER